MFHLAVENGKKIGLSFGLKQHSRERHICNDSEGPSKPIICFNPWHRSL